MGWFDEQIKQRIQTDDDSFSDAFASMASAVTGEKLEGAWLDDRAKTQNAIDEILKFYHVKTTELPPEINDLGEQLEYLLRPSGVMRRIVKLSGNWYTDAVGAFLGTLKTGGAVALIPHGVSGYVFYDHETGKYIKLNKKTADLLDTEAYCFYKPLPLKKLSMMDLLKYIAGTLQTADYVLIFAASLAVTLIGLIGPAFNNILFSSVIDNKSVQLLLAVTVMLAAASISGILIETVKNILMERLQTKASASVQAASMMRMLSLPANFFRQYSAGELSNRIQSINSLCMLLGGSILQTGLTLLLSLIYIAQIFQYAPSLAIPAIIILLVTALFLVFSTYLQTKYSREILKLEAKESGLTYSFIAGVQKLKLAGAEKRAFSKWAAEYAQKAKLTYNPPLAIKLTTVIATGITMIGTIVLYYNAIQYHVTTADYISFNVAYGMVSGSFLTFASVAANVALIKPMFEMIKPLLEEVPEVSEGKKVLTSISGSVELNNVSFRYRDSMPMIFDNLSLKIRAGQYVAIVGKTGCGKSTLMRLLLGFETPQRGAIYYDGKDITKLDLRSLRRKIGVVTQDGKLFAGDIYSNIVISAPWLTMDDAWQAAEMADIADNIRDMPMGMNTFITEGSGGISGGQRQRLMIARAIAPKPKLLMFDEATSALDNITQKKVVESLGKLKCTRIVIAHRLSTIRECDRIIVLDGGKIREDGSYDELIKQNGFFADLVKRQLVEETE